MAADFDLWDRIPKPLADVSMKLVELAEKSGSLTISYSTDTKVDDQGIRYAFWNQGIKGFDACLLGDLLLGLENLEFIRKDDTTKYQKYLFVTLRALEWAEYERASGFIKWWTRSREHVRDIGLVVIGLLTVGLTVIQILEALM